MKIGEILYENQIVAELESRDKAGVLRELAAHLCANGGDAVPTSPDEVSRALLERERLGCTSLEKGAAFPHCRIDGVENSVAVLIKLSEPVDFDSPDGEPVDIVLGMMLPAEITDEHRADVKLVTSVLADQALRARLREMNSSKDLYEALISGAETAWQANCA